MAGIIANISAAQWQVAHPQIAQSARFVGERLELHDRLADGNEKPVLLGLCPNLVHHERAPCSSSRHRRWISRPSCLSALSKSFATLVFMPIAYRITENNTTVNVKTYNLFNRNLHFSVRVCGGIFATLIAVDALIVFLRLCGLFQTGRLDPQLS